MFSEGASVVAVPESSRGGRNLSNAGQGSDPERAQALTPEQFQRKAQSRGLWDGGANKAPSQPTQPRAGTLPRAVVGGVGNANPGAANTNFRNPSIGNEVSPPLPAALAAAQPLGAAATGQASLDAAAAANQAAKQQRELDLGLAETEDVRMDRPAARGRDIRTETDPDVMDTMELDMAKFIQKGGLPQKPQAQAADQAATAGAAAPGAQGVPGAQGSQTLQAAQAGQAARAGDQAGAKASPAAPAVQAETPPSVAAQAAQAAAKATTTEKLATRATPSTANSAILLVLIVIAALIAVLFIGAALGIWHLPWASSAAHTSLSKTVSAKSLPEMRTPVVPAAPAAQIMPTATAAPATPAQLEEPALAAAAPTAPVAPGGPAVPAAAAAAASGEAQPATATNEAVEAMAADEAAPLHAAANSGGDPEDDLDRPPLDVTEVLSSARAELRAGHAKEAEALLRPALEKDPNDHHVAELLVQALIARGAAVEAVAVAQRIVKKRPKRASYRVLLGDALRRAGDEPSAKAAYREALALDPNLRDAHARLGKMN